MQRGNFAINRAKLLEYVRKRKVVGITCLYKQELKYKDQEEPNRIVDDGLPFEFNEQTQLHENRIMIGIALFHVHKPRKDSVFPEELTKLPIFQGRVKLDKSSRSHSREEYKSVSSFSVDETTQVANILLLAVVPQCRRSGIGTLLYKKALWHIETNFRDCVLIYGQKNDTLHNILSWRSVVQFLNKNHFKCLNEEQLPESGKLIMYYPITNIVRRKD